MFPNLWIFMVLLRYLFFGPKMSEAKTKISLDIAVLEIWRAWARKKDPHLHLLKMIYVSKGVKVVLYTSVDQPAQRFSEMFPLETGAYITE